MLTGRSDMAEEHRKELREFGEAFMRWAAWVPGETPGNRAEEEALHDAFRDAALRYPPIAAAESGGSDEEVNRATDKAASDYWWLVMEQVASRGAGAMAIAVALMVTLRFRTGSSPEGNLEAAVLSATWWGAPAVVAGGLCWAMRRDRSAPWQAVFPVPRGAREWLRWVVQLGICSLGSTFSLAAVSLGFGVVVDSRYPGFVSDGFVIGVLCYWICLRPSWRAMRRGLAQPI